MLYARSCVWPKDKRWDPKWGVFSWAVVVVCIIWPFFIFVVMSAIIFADNMNFINPLPVETPEDENNSDPESDDGEGRRVSLKKVKKVNRDLSLKAETMIKRLN